MAVPGADTEARERLRMLLRGSETERDVDFWLRPDPPPRGFHAVGEPVVLPPPKDGNLASLTYLDEGLADPC